MKDRACTSGFVVRLLGVLTVSVLASGFAVACSSEPQLAAVPVDPGGFRLTAGGVTVSGGAGVAPEGTQATIERTDDQLPNEVQQSVTAGGAPVRVELDEGQVQPASPLTFDFELDADRVNELLAAGKIPVVLVRSEGSEQNDVIEASWNKDTSTLTASVPHLSLVWPSFLDPKGVFDSVAEGIKRALGMTFPKPECVGRTADFAVTSYGVTPVTEDVAWPCIRKVLQAQEGTLTIDLQSNSPYLWTVRADPSFLTKQFTTIDMGSYPAGALYQQLVNQGDDSETVLLPGQQLSLGFGPYEQTPDSGTLTFDVGTWTLGLIGYGIGWVLEKFSPGKYAEMIENADVIECMRGINSGANGNRAFDAGMVGDFVKSVIGCVGLLGGSVFSLLAGGFGATLVAPLVGVLTGTPPINKATFEVTTTRKEIDPFFSNSGGVSGYYFKSPSGQWKCAILVTDNMAGCQPSTSMDIPIAGAPQVPDPATGAPMNPNAISVAKGGEPEFSWIRQAIFWRNDGDSAVLDYGKSLTQNGFTCTMQEVAISCREDVSGKGFTFTTAGYAYEFTALGSAPPTALAAAANGGLDAVIGRPTDQYSVGYGSERPETLSINSLCGNTITNISWTTWGNESATGTGTKCAPAGSPKDGGPVSLVATDLGDCGGAKAYRSLVIAGGSKIDVCGGE
ncbi:hypothetical protein [Rhodococcoides fascians]|uniref:hypothetical protein n=1 Tax=Rhodococcoides fascians TaxID=1828 RepID=UPI000AD82E8E|nr:hypothetical protein [Rhodococcus fascians]